MLPTGQLALKQSLCTTTVPLLEPPDEPPEELLAIALQQQLAVDPLQPTKEQLPPPPWQVNIFEQVVPLVQAPLDDIPEEPPDDDDIPDDPPDEVELDPLEHIPTYGPLVTHSPAIKQPGVPLVQQGGKSHPHVKPVHVG